MDRPTVERLRNALQIPDAIAQVLVIRGYETAEEVARYWAPSLDSLHSPSEFRDMGVAVDRIRSAVASRELIRVYGDYDVDGISATTLLMKQLRRMEAVADYRIPNRFADGYGIAAPAVQEAVADGVKLLVTVDCGVSNKEEVAYGNSLGVDTVIIDHHTCPPEMPEAVAVVDPKQKDEK